MRALRAVTDRRHLAVWIGLAVAVIGGLLGMHALNLHAQTPHTTITHAATDPAAADGVTPHGAMDHGAAHRGPAPLACDGCDEQPAGHEAAMACVLALLMTLLLLPTRRWLATLVERIQGHASSPALHGFGPSPTRSLHELSVIRT